MAAQADPNTSTRAVFTEVLINNPIPDHACEDWKNQVKTLKELYQLLANHPGMSRNNEQLFAQPAHEKNTVYFMWDFVGRTIVCSHVFIIILISWPFRLHCLICRPFLRSITL